MTNKQLAEQFIAAANYNNDHFDGAIRSFALWLDERATAEPGEKPAGYKKCLHSLANALEATESAWSEDGWCADCAWSAAKQLLNLHIEFCSKRGYMMGHCWHNDPQPMNAAGGSGWGGSHGICCFCGDKRFFQNCTFNEPHHGPHRP